MGALELLDNLWSRTARRRQIQFEKATIWMEQKDKFTPFCRKKIMANLLISRKGAQTALVTAHNGADSTLEARVRCAYDGIGERIHTVRCQDFFCTCGRFQEWLLPCSHAITAIRTVRRDPYEWIAQFWEPYAVHVANTTAAGPDRVYVAVENLAMRTVKTDDIKPEWCHDPCFAPEPKAVKAGPNQRKRKETGDRAEGVRRERASCSRCGQVGQNKRNRFECPSARADQAR